MTNYNKTVCLQFKLLYRIIKCMSVALSRGFNPNVSAIVPLLNEEKTIANVVQQLLASPLIEEVICVIDDGSVDNSRTILQSFGNKITLLDIGKNKGKGHAMCKGIEEATGTVTLFVDADILNLSHTAISKLITTLTNNPSLKAVLGYPPTRHSFAKLFLPLTGERAYYRKDLLPHLRKMETAGYGVEVYLNTVFLRKHTKIISLPKLQLLEKREKQSITEAVKYELRAAVQLSIAIAKREGFLPQDYDILKEFLRVKTFTELRELFERTQNEDMQKILLYVIKSPAFFEAIATTNSRKLLKIAKKIKVQKLVPSYSFEDYKNRVKQLFID